MVLAALLSPLHVVYVMRRGLVALSPTASRPPGCSSMGRQSALDYKLVGESSLGKGGLQQRYLRSMTSTGRDAASCTLALNPKSRKGLQ